MPKSAIPPKSEAKIRRVLVDEDAQETTILQWSLNQVSELYIFWFIRGPIGPKSKYCYLR